MIARTTTRLALIPTLLALLVACGNEGGSVLAAPAGSDLEPTTYVVTGVTVDGEPRDLVKGTEIRLSFRDGHLGISAGCNSMGGAYRLDGSRLSVEPLSMTDMGCAAPLMQQDSWAAGLFEDPVQLITGDDASIISGGTVLSLTDREAVSPDQPLAGTKWMLDTLIDGTGPDGAASSVPGGAVAYLEIRGGRAFGYDSCNSVSATVAVAGSTITFGGLGQTLRGCPDDGHRVSGAFHEVIQAKTTFTIEEKTLTITRGDRALGFHAVQEFPAHD